MAEVSEMFEDQNETKLSTSADLKEKLLSDNQLNELMEYSSFLFLCLNRLFQPVRKECWVRLIYGMRDSTNHPNPVNIFHQARSDVDRNNMLKVNGEDDTTVEIQVGGTFLTRIQAITTLKKIRHRTRI